MISSVRFRLVTVSKLAWPASSDAAAFVVSCLSESPVPMVAGRPEHIYRKKKLLNTICQQHICSCGDRKLAALTALGYGFL